MFRYLSKVAFTIFRSLPGVILFLSLLQTVSADESITVAGDPCTLPLMEELAETFGKRTGMYSKVTSGTCMSGVRRVTDGEVIIGVTTQLMDSTPAGCFRVVIAKAPIVMIVNRENKVDNLSFEELKKIFSGEITNWSGVGGADLPIKLVMLEPCVKDSVSKLGCYYTEATNPMKIFPLVSKNAVTDTCKLVAEEVAALGQTIYGYESSNVKVLMIDGYLPGQETLPSRYRLYEDYNLLTLGEPTVEVREFIDFILSPQGQQIVANLRHIPVRPLE
ncbi:MAG: substrate-binding domain-containing protein [Planctomycetota bacterium]|jgi:phosphate transport system substrate-binding protein